MLNPHEIIEILGEPRKMEVKMDHLQFVYWSIPAVLKSDTGLIYESAVTFELLEEAIALKVGDIFKR